MELTFDTQSFLGVFVQIALNAWSYLVAIFWAGGWIVILILIARWVIGKLWKLYMMEVQGHYASGIDRVQLAIKVPKATEQTPKAVENIFSHLTGLYSGKGNAMDLYVKGKFQESFSCELVSINGVIQFLVNTPVKFRDVIESSIYAQYPDVEIIQVPDYVDTVPLQYPSETHDLWGTELALVKPQAYPIKTYTAFEHVLPGSFKDPINSLLEFMGSLRPGEQVWIQIILKPTDDEWQKESDVLVKKMTGVKIPPPKPGRLVKILSWFIGVIEGLIGEVWPGLIPPPAKSADNAPLSTIQHMSPGERAVLEQVQMKSSKPGFFSKIRIIYVAPKEVFNKGKIMAGVLGAFKQYGSSHLNGFKPESNSKVGAGYFNANKVIAEKQNLIVNSYKKRSAGYQKDSLFFEGKKYGGKPYILNVEELATLWHFPMIETKAPLVTRSSFKRAEPPAELPMRDISEPDTKKTPTTIESGDEMPSNLPFA